MINKAKKNGLKGQAVLEYIGLIGIIVLAFFALSMQNYFKRAMANKLRQDVVGTFGAEQYYGTNTNIIFYQTLNATYLPVIGGKI